MWRITWSGLWALAATSTLGCTDDTTAAATGGKPDAAVTGSSGGLRTGTGGSSGAGGSSGTGGSSGNAGSSGTGGSNGGGGSSGSGASSGNGGSSGGSPASGGNTSNGGQSPLDSGPGTPSPALGVVTQHNDNARTGQNTGETVLTPANVDSTHFGRKFSQPIDGYAYAEPLVALNVTVGGATRNLVFVATEHDSVYAFDADAEGPAVWHVSFLGNGVTAVPPADTGEVADLVPEIGITSTPVIDLGTSTLYVVAKTKETGPSYFFRVHALDLATGAEKLGGPVAVQASINGTGADSVGGVLGFDALHDLQRPALLLSGGTLYIAFGDHGDHFNWHGWVLGYDATTLQQKYVFCTTPDGNEASIWQSGAGIAADSASNLYLETGNGDMDAPSGGRDFGMSVVKLNSKAAVVDWFAPYDYQSLSNFDLDLGSSGPMVLPDQTGAHPHLVVGSGKPGVLYILNRDDMGHVGASNNNQILQTVSVKPNGTGITAGIFTSPVYWNGTLYVAAVDDSVKAFTVRAGVVSASPTSASTRVFGYPGGALSVSANGTRGGIVWAVEGDGYTPKNPAVLHAFDATDLSKELYSSDQAAGGRDAAGAAVKFSVPAVVNGHVYFATQTELEVYGLL